MNDLIYRWKSVKPVQMADKLSLPSGFVMDMYNHSNCDVVTATGKKIKAFLETARMGTNLSFVFRGIQLPEGGAHVRPAALLLHRDHLRPLLHDRHRVLDVLLDRPQSGEGEIRRVKPQLGKEEEEEEEG